MTTPIPLRIRQLNPLVEVDAFRRMFLEVYGHPMSQAQWQWKYAAGPRTSAHNLVAEHQHTGQLLGHIGAIVLPGYHPQVPRQPLHWTQIGDIMVIAQARGDLGEGGVYRQLVAHMQRHLINHHSHHETEQLYAYGFPGQRPFRLGERLGFYRRLYTCENHLYTPMGKSKALSPVWWRKRWWVPHIALNAAPVWDDAILDQLWQKLSATLVGPGAIKDSAYLRWRYQNHPQLAYTLWWCLHKSRPVGWLITAQVSGNRIMLVDSLVHPLHWPQAAQALAVQYAGQPCEGWRVAPGTSSSTTPIVATEMRVNQFHQQWPHPQFQPGDTDVF